MPLDRHRPRQSPAPPRRALPPAPSTAWPGTRRRSRHGQARPQAGSGRLESCERLPAGPPRHRCKATVSPWQVLPGQDLVSSILNWQGQDTFGDYVAQYLRCASLDRVPLGPQVAVSGAASEEVHPAGALLRPAAGEPVVVAQPVGADQLELEARYLLREPRELELDRRSLGAGLADYQLLGETGSGKPHHLGAHPQPHEFGMGHGRTELGVAAPSVRHRLDGTLFARGDRAAD